MPMKQARVWMFMSLFAVCLVASSALASDEPVTVTYLMHAWHGDGWHNFMREIAAEFMEHYPNVTVDIITGAADYVDKFRVMTAVGTPPDITDFNTGYGHLAIEGLFLDLSPYLAREGAFRDNILENALELYTTEGVVWGMPNSLFMVVSWFNRDLLDIVGLVPPTELSLDEWNWETLRDYARKLTIDRDGDGINEQWGLDRQSAAWIQFIASNGGYLYERRDNPATSLWNSEPVLEAIEFNRQLMRDDRVASIDWDANTYFHTGRSGMAVVDGPGALASLMDVDFAWDIAVLPAGPRGCHCGSVSGDGFQINAYSENPDIAWEFLRFVTMRPESIAAFVRHTGRFPALVGVHEVYPQLNPVAPENWRAFLDAASHPGAYFAPTLPAFSRIEPIANSVLTQIWYGEVAPQVGLQQIHEQVQAILDEWHN